MTIPPNLEERLALLQVEPNESGRLGARVRVAALPAGTKRHRARGWFLAGAAAALLMLSPPGQSFAEVVGDFVGIGDEPTGGPQFTNPGETRDDTVIATGEAPSGEPFELVETNPVKSATGSRPQGDATCVYTNFPDSQPQANLAQCLTVAVVRKLSEGTWIDPVAVPLPGHAGSSPSLLVNAYASSDVESLGLVVDGQETPMTSGVLGPDSEGAASMHARYGAGFVPANALDYERLTELAPALDGPNKERFALLDEGSPDSEEAIRLLGGIEVVGYGADGSELFRRAVVNSPSDAFGVLMSFAIEAQRQRDRTSAAAGK
jgi:hypothetical protein